MWLEKNPKKWSKCFRRNKARRNPGVLVLWLNESFGLAIFGLEEATRLLLTSLNKVEREKRTGICGGRATPAPHIYRSLLLEGSFFSALIIELSKILDDQYVSNLLILYGSYQGLVKTTVK